MNHYPVTKNSPAKFGNLCKFSQEKEEIWKRYNFEKMQWTIDLWDAFVVLLSKDDRKNCSNNKDIFLL